MENSSAVVMWRGRKGSICKCQKAEIQTCWKSRQEFWILSGCKGRIAVREVVRGQDSTLPDDWIFTGTEAVFPNLDHFQVPLFLGHLTISELPLIFGLGPPHWWDPFSQSWDKPWAHFWASHLKVAGDSLDVLRPVVREAVEIVVMAVRPCSSTSSAGSCPSIQSVLASLCAVVSYKATRMVPALWPPATRVSLCASTSSSAGRRFECYCEN